MSKNLFDFGDQVFDSNENTNNQNNLNINENDFDNDINSNLKNNNFNQFSTNNQDNQNTQNSFSSNIQEEAKSLYDKYSTYSQQDLIQEFISTSKQKMQEGSLSKEKINQTASLLSPYLNSQQKEMLKTLMEKIDD